MTLFTIIVPLIFLCCLPAICFEIYDRLIPEGSLWIGNDSGLVFTVKLEVSPYDSREVVRADVLGDYSRGLRITSDRISFRKEFTRVPKKDEPLYYLAQLP